MGGSVVIAMTNEPNDSLNDFTLIDAKEVWAMLHGYKECFADLTQKEEPHILLRACCVISDYIKLLESNP